MSLQAASNEVELQLAQVFVVSEFEQVEPAVPPKIAADSPSSAEEPIPVKSLAPSTSVRVIAA